MKKFFDRLYIEILHFMNEVLDINHIISYMIGIITGFFIFYSSNYYIVLGVIVAGSAVNELFFHFLSSEPEKVIIVQTDDESSSEFLERLDTTIKSSVGDMNKKKENKND